jgi:hypothetical protein
VTARALAARALAIGLAISLAMTFPLALHLGSRVLEDGSYDPFQFLWNIWWVRESLVVLHTNPFFTRLLFYPEGVPLVFHTFSFPLGVASIPLQAAVGLVPAHNLLVIAAPALTVAAVALLAHEATGDAWASVAGGVVAAVNPIGVWFVPVLYLSCAYLIAFTLWAWWRLQRLRRARDVAYVVGLVAILVFASQEYAMMALGLLALDTAVRALAPRAAGLPPAWGAGTIAVWVLLAIALGALAAAALSGPASPPPSTQVLLGSGYLAGLLVPPWLSPPPAPFWTLLYLGTIPIALFLVALARGGVAARWWTLALVVTVLMCMGPYLHLHHPLPSLRLPPGGLHPSGPPGPYWLALEVLPLLRWFRAPYRWVTATEIVLGVLGAIAVAAIRAHAGRAAGVVTAAVVAATLAGGALDAHGLRAPLESTAIPAVYDRIRDDPGHGAVLDLPAGFQRDGLALFSSVYMYYQTRHGHPLLDGTVSRTPPGARFVWQRPLDDLGALPDVEWVVLHRDLAAIAHPAGRAQMARVEQELATAAELVARDGPVELYRLRTFRARRDVGLCRAPAPV